MKTLKNIFRIWIFASIGLINYYRRLPDQTIILIHGSGVGPDSESFLHAHTVVKLYKKSREKISYIVASGYDANKDFLQSEGEYITEILVKNGVPYDLILTESKALTTPENIIRALYLLKDKGVNPTRFNFVAIHRPSYIWKAHYLWKILNIQVYMVIASIEPWKNFLKNIKHQYEYIDKFLKNPIEEELKTAELRSKTRTHFSIQPLEKKDFEREIERK